MEITVQPSLATFYICLQHNGHNRFKADFCPLAGPYFPPTEGKALRGRVNMQHPMYMYKRKHFLSMHVHVLLANAMVYRHHLKRSLIIQRFSIKVATALYQFV